MNISPTEWAKGLVMVFTRLKSWSIVVLNAATVVGLAVCFAKWNVDDACAQRAFVVGIIALTAFTLILAPLFCALVYYLLCQYEEEE